MMPTVSRHELESDDIVAEVGIVRMRKGPDHGGVGNADSQCAGKRRHETYTEAHALTKTHSNLETYRCRHCRGWHNGNRKQK